MCEWVEVCPSTWRSKEDAPCNAIMEFWIPTIEDTVIFTRDLLPDIMHSAWDSNGLASAFFSTWWASNKRSNVR